MATALAAHRGQRRASRDAAARGARRRLADRAGLPPDADADGLREAAARLGLDDAEIDAVLGDGDALAAGRALAKLEARR